MREGIGVKYAEKLKDPRWQRRRLEIFTRDGWICRRCKNGEDPLVVHHLCYFPKTEPWEYDGKYLLTLCESCHELNDFKTLGSLVDQIILNAFLLSRRRGLEEVLENDYSPEKSIELDCILFFVGKCR